MIFFQWLIFFYDKVVYIYNAFRITENKTRNHPFLMAKNRSKKYKECFIKRRTADVQEIFLFCCLSKKKYILCCPINRCKVSHHYFALLVDLSSFLKQNMSYANVVLVFHSPMRTSAKMDQYLPSRFFNRHADRSFFCCC